MKIVSIHQPHFLPWAGYLNKALRSDVFVWLHSVQFRKNYYQNRTRIKNSQSGQPFWLTLPVHAHLGMPIDQVTLADAKGRERVHKTVEQFYRKAPHFAETWPSLVQAMNEASDNLNDVNYRTFLALLRLLDGNSLHVVNASELSASSEDPTMRLVEICTELGATHYIAGKGGHNYLRVDEFDKVGIKVLWQEFNPSKVIYRQQGETFLPGLSVIDCLFNEGSERTKELIVNAWTP